MPDTLTQEQFVAWVREYFRNIDPIGFEPWTDLEHGHRMLGPVPPQHVRFDKVLPVVERPDHRRISVLIQRRRLIGA